MNFRSRRPDARMSAEELQQGARPALLDPDYDDVRQAPPSRLRWRHVWWRHFRLSVRVTRPVMMTVMTHCCCWWCWTVHLLIPRVPDVSQSDVTWRHKWRTVSVVWQWPAIYTVVTTATDAVASPASGHVGTCPPWRLRFFFSLYVETSCLVWFGTMPNSKSPLGYLFSRIRFGMIS